MIPFIPFYLHSKNEQRHRHLHHHRQCHHHSKNQEGEYLALPAYPRLYRSEVQTTSESEFCVGSSFQVIDGQSIITKSRGVCMHVCMYGCMYVWMDGWMDACRVVSFRTISWWRHKMEALSALLALCAGNSPVIGEFPSQRPVTRSFDVFFDLPANKQLSKQSWCWWFETPSCSL